MDLPSLPNELLLLIFQYIPTVVLLQTFGSLDHHRLTTLLQSFLASLTSLNFTHERLGVEWLRNWLPSFEASSYDALRITHAQLFQLDLNRFSSRRLEISEIFSPLRLDHFPKRTPLESLSLCFDPTHYDRERVPSIIAPLLKSIANMDNHLRSLSMTGCTLGSSAALNVGHACHLQYLNLSVDSQSSFEVLLAVLPVTMQYLTVRIVNNPCLPQTFAPSPWSPQSTRCRLRRLTLAADEVNYLHLVQTLSQQSGLNILSLTISMRKMTLIDGEQFHHDLVHQLPELTHFDFALSMTTVRSNLVDLEAYVQTFHDQPVLAYYSASFSTLNVASHSCVALDNISIAFLSYHTNTPEPVLLPRVRFLRFVTDDRLPLALLHFVRQTAPHVRHLVLNGHYLSHEELCREIPFGDVRILELNWLDHQSMARVLLRLAPNVHQLILAGYQPNYAILVDSSEQLSRVRQQIHTVVLDDYEISKRQAIDDNLKQIFPQARIIYTNS